jgi:hypothetical protein
MTNGERRAALNAARANALRHARNAEEKYSHSAEDGPEVQLATMWAHVANAMKDGSPDHDAPDGQPINNVLNTEYGVITR